MDSFAGKVGFITGAASGIGFALAQTLGLQGMKLILADVEKHRLEEASDRLAERGIDVAPFVVDVTDRKAMFKAREFCLARYQGINLLINNAGVNAPGALYEVTYEDWDWVLGVNLNGVVNGIQEFLPTLMSNRGDAHIINIASVGGLVGMRGLGIYNASKFGVVGLSEALRADMEGMGVGVSVVCPGMVKTNLSSSDRNRPSPLRKSQQSQDEPVVEQKIGSDPLELAQQVIEGVKSGKFFINTHPEFGPVIEQRNEAVNNSFDKPNDLNLVDTMKEMVLPF